MALCFWRPLPRLRTMLRRYVVIATTTKSHLDYQLRAHPKAPYWQAFINTARKIYEKIEQGVFDVTNEVRRYTDLHYDQLPSSLLQDSSHLVFVSYSAVLRHQGGLWSGWWRRWRHSAPRRLSGCSKVQLLLLEQLMSVIAEAAAADVRSQPPQTAQAALLHAAEVNSGILAVSSPALRPES